jgi:hypothetical protein
MNDEEKLQQEAEAGKPNRSVDAKAYQKVFEVLNREPDHTLPIYFADNVIAIVEARDRVRFTTTERVCFGLVVLILLLLLVSAVVVTGFAIDWGFLTAIGPFAPVLAFGVAMLLFFHALDKRLLKSAHNEV